MTKKWTKESDDADDKAKGVKEGSKKDKAIDKKRGVPEERPSMQQPSHPDHKMPVPEHNGKMLPPSSRTNDGYDE